VPNKVKLMSGNEAVAEGGLAAGVRFFAGYPISPSTEIAEVMSRRLPELGGKFIQMEDEIASIAAVIGASLTGVKAMDATSGPGFSLKAENLGLAVMLETPLVLVDVQRVGPSTGIATLPAQGDVMMARWGTHGDHSIIALAPWSVEESFYLTVKAVNLSEQFRTPVLLMSDAIIGYMKERVTLPDPASLELVERPRPRTAPGEGEYLPYGADSTLVPPMASFGEGYHWYANSSYHDQHGFEATANNKEAEYLIWRLHAKIDEHRPEVMLTESYMMDDAEIVFFAYGSVARSALAAVRQGRERGLKLGLFRAKTLWPFADQEVKQIAQMPNVKAIIVPEMNMGQLVTEVRAAAGAHVPVISLPHYNGRMIEPEMILTAVERFYRGELTEETKQFPELAIARHYSQV
jgi:2-oxoglutarate/2-oxoacid ferredoxin oxidoreductase subunit alpha